MNLWCPVIKRKGIIVWIHIYPNWKTSFNSKNGTKWSFSFEIKASIHLSQWVERICGAQSLKKKRLLCEFMFIPVERWNLILKNVEKEVFLMKPRNQYYLSQWGECLYAS